MAFHFLLNANDSVPQVADEDVVEDRYHSWEYQRLLKTFACERSLMRSESVLKQHQGLKSAARQDS